MSLVKHEFGYKFVVLDAAGVLASLLRQAFAMLDSLGLPFSNCTNRKHVEGAVKKAAVGVSGDHIGSFFESDIRNVDGHIS